LALTLSFPPASRIPSLPSFPTRRSSDLHLGADIVIKLHYMALCPLLVFDLFYAAGAVFVLRRIADRIKLGRCQLVACSDPPLIRDRKSTRLNSSHVSISYAVFCLKNKKL